MNEAGVAAEQVIRIGLEGSEYVLKIAGKIGKNLGERIADAVKSGKPTKGKLRLKEMMREGAELSVFSIFKKDVQAFAKYAKKYGLTYCLVKVRNEKDPLSSVDIICRKDDVVRVNRIIEKYLVEDEKDKEISNAKTKEDLRSHARNTANSNNDKLRKQTESKQGTATKTRKTRTKSTSK